MATFGLFALLSGSIAFMPTILDNEIYLLLTRKMYEALHLALMLYSTGPFTAHRKAPFKKLKVDARFRFLVYQYQLKRKLSTYQFLNGCIFQSLLLLNRPKQTRN